MKKLRSEGAAKSPPLFFMRWLYKDPADAEPQQSHGPFRVNGVPDGGSIFFLDRSPCLAV